MTDLDRLPPDQRAVLSLVLDRGKSYSEVADMLAIPESAVRDRAHAALDALAREPGGAPLGIPSSPPPAPTSGPVTPTPGPSRPTLPTRGAGRTQASSRMGGALLLGGFLVAIVVAVILITSGGKGSSHTAGKPSTSTSKSTSTSSATKPKLNKTITLTAAEPSLKANGLAYVLSEGGRRAFYVAAQGLPPSSGFFYAVWLYNSPSSSAPLGRAPTVSSSGRMEGGGPLPTNAGDYRKLIITRETSTHPTRPGQVVLSGNFGLH